MYILYIYIYIYICIIGPCVFFFRYARVMQRVMTMKSVYTLGMYIVYEDINKVVYKTMIHTITRHSFISNDTINYDIDFFLVSWYDGRVLKARRRSPIG